MLERLRRRLTALFGLLTVFELNRAGRSRTEALLDAAVSPLTMSGVRLVSLTTAALLTLAVGWWIINKVSARLGKLVGLRNADLALQGFISTLANIVLKVLLLVSVAALL